jgi:glycerol-1-phosphate dehydrogenase [NAD(P)+]
MAKTGKTIEVPDKLEDLLGFSAVCGCGKRHSVELAFASIRNGALEDAVPFAREVGRHIITTIVADKITKTICGDKVERLLNSDGFATKMVVVPSAPGGRPHADEDALKFVESALEDADLAVAVGSGTINDLTKLASFNRSIPYMTVATAPSMNGYTSAISAIMQRGIKHTVECRQPYALVADLDILCKAPPELISAGFGDLESKPTSTADYRLSGFLRGSYYCPAPERVVLSAEARAAAGSYELGRSHPNSIACLTEALVLSGISMKLAGSSSPASGGEHLISHHWDMTAKEEGRIEGWHGAQVGVATIVTSTLYEHLRAVDPKSIDIDYLIASRPGRKYLERAIRLRHGSKAEDVMDEYFAKHLSDEDLARELALIRDKWSELWSKLGEVLRPADFIRGLLSGAGAPINVRELGLTPEHLMKSFIAAREIRGRFTVLDFAADLGLLDSLRMKVLKASGCLGL